MAIKKKIRVESLNSQGMFLGMVVDDIKIKKCSLGQTGGAAGPENFKQNLRIYSSIFLSLKLSTWLYENGQCFGVPGYPENVAPNLIFWEPLGFLRGSKKN